MSLAADLRHEFADCLPPLEEEKAVLAETLRPWRQKVAALLGEVARSEAMGVPQDPEQAKTPADKAEAESLQRLLADLRRVGAGIRGVEAHIAGLGPQG